MPPHRFTVRRFMVIVALASVLLPMEALMSMPRPRFTVCRFMVIVALLSIAFGFPLGTIRSMIICSEMARYHFDLFSKVNIARNERMTQVGLHHREVELLNRRTRYHLLMGRKWEKAVHHPWFPEPDPPESR